jgi:hypothetical protein
MLEVVQQGREDESSLLGRQKAVFRWRMVSLALTLSSTLFA